MNEIKLEPCPFCGGEAVYCTGYITDDKQYFGVGIWCSICEANIRREVLIPKKDFGQYVDKMRAEVIEAWNKRAKDAEVV